MDSIASHIRNGHVEYLDLHSFVTADEADPLREVIRRMRQCDCTAALITRGSRLAGIFTERDVLQKVLGRGVDLESSVSGLMTAEPVVASPEITLLEALRRMRDGYFRNLPVVDQSGTILGNLTDSAIVSYLCEHLQAEVLNLPPDPNQVPKTVEGS